MNDGDKKFEIRDVHPMDMANYIYEVKTYKYAFDEPMGTAGFIGMILGLIVMLYLIFTT